MIWGYHYFRKHPYAWGLVHPGRWTWNLRIFSLEKKKIILKQTPNHHFEVRFVHLPGVYKKLEILIKRFGSSDSLVIWKPEVWLVCRKLNKIDEYDLFLSTRLILYRRRRMPDSAKVRSPAITWHFDVTCVLLLDGIWYISGRSFF